jgi:eukaryotic-like serine/threonine-protein kinase
MTTAKSFVFLCSGVGIRKHDFSVVKDGKVLSVEPRAYRLLIHLLRNPRRIITREELQESVCDDAAVTENSFF